MKKLPNLLSILRILFACSLLALIKQPPIFFSVYVLLGIMDVFDGWLARKLQAESELGARLDSLGDLVFYVISLYIIFFHMQIKIPHMLSMLVLSVFLLKLCTLILTKWKHHVWASMHTRANTITDILLFLLVPLCFYLKALPFVPALLVIICSYLASFEEILLVFTSETYDIHTKSIWKKHHEIR